MKHPTSMALCAHWDGCRDGADFPDHGSLRLQALGPAVTDAFTLEPPLRRGVYGFCGSALAFRYGRDLSGESFLAQWSGEDRTVLERHLRSMACGGAGMVLGVTAETAAGGFTAFEVLLLPVAQAGGVGAVGSMARVGGHDVTNRIRARIVAQFLRSVRILPPSPVRKRKNKPAAQVAIPARLPRRTFGHLTLIAGGK